MNPGKERRSKRKRNVWQDIVFYRRASIGHCRRNKAPLLRFIFPSKHRKRRQIRASGGTWKRGESVGCEPTITIRIARTPRKYRANPCHTV